MAFGDFFAQPGPARQAPQSGDNVAQRRHSFRPGLEALEIRLTLSLTTLATFGAYPNGYDAVGGVIMDSSGNLYGTTAGGGANRDGTVFEVAQGSGAITTLATFDGTNGMTPEASLIMDSTGNLYGTTIDGGTSWNGTTNDGYGTVFELAKGSGTIATLVSFTGINGNGEDPHGGVIMDSSGNLYGTAVYGHDSPGAVFELAHGSSTITTLASFDSTTGEYPVGGVIMDSSGNLYGTTAGNSGYGTLFELAHGSRNITVLAYFDTTQTSGTYPYDSLIMDSSGNLYGTASHGGGQAENGTVFEWVHGSHQITTLASFNNTDGRQPDASLIMGSSGNLYGTTALGGASDGGTVFELAKGRGTITTLVSFNGADGSQPEDALIMDSSGNLYGTTDIGGASNGGTVFELSGVDALPALQISGLRFSSGAGASRTFTVTAPNAVGTTDNGHAGTVDFTTNDRTANLVANATAPDMETDPFSGLVPQKKGKSSITETLFSSITGSLIADGS